VPFLLSDEGQVRFLPEISHSDVRVGLCSDLLIDRAHEFLAQFTNRFASTGMMLLILGTQLARSLDSLRLTVYNFGLVEPYMKRIERFVNVPVLVSGHVFSPNRVQNTDYAMKMRWYGSTVTVSVWF
jgi:hypothetical protein